MDIDMSERDAFLQAICDSLYERGEIITAETICNEQTVYDLDACQKFIDENCNGN